VNSERFVDIDITQIDRDRFASAAVLNPDACLGQLPRLRRLWCCGVTVAAAMSVGVNTPAMIAFRISVSSSSMSRPFPVLEAGGGF
jgi:hypothetical protein